MSKKKEPELPVVPAVPLSPLEQKVWEAIQEGVISVHHIIKDRYKDHYRLVAKARLAKHSLSDLYLYIKWMTGGMGGGSCWDDGSQPTHHYSIDGEPEPDFDDLDTLLLKLCPDITFLQYKKLINGLVKQSSYTEDEYYGNSTTYGVKTISLSELVAKLQEMGLA